jgi:hypothetical protein
MPESIISPNQSRTKNWASGINFGSQTQPGCTLSAVSLWVNLGLTPLASCTAVKKNFNLLLKSFSFYFFKIRTLLWTVLCCRSASFWCRSGSGLESKWCRSTSGSYIKFYTCGQCCGSGMFIPDPDFNPSRIQKQEQKRGVKKNLLSYLFL